MRERITTWDNYFVLLDEVWIRPRKELQFPIQVYILATVPQPVFQPPTPLFNTLTPTVFLTVTFDPDLHRVIVNQSAKYLGQSYFV